MGPNIDVSIVLAVYNEAGHLTDEIDRIKKAMDETDYRYEIIVVDDGSTDGSGDRLREVEGIRLLQFGQNRGAGSARKYGTLAAQGRIVVWTDVDMTYPNDSIPELVTQMEGWDQVVGARMSEQGTLKLLRRPAKWFVRKLAEYLTTTKIPDLNSGYRAFRRDVADQFLHLLPKGFSCVTTLTMAFLANGYSVRFVPISYYPRTGASKFHWWRDTKRYLSQVVRMAMMWEPMRLFGPPAAGIGIVGVGKLAYDMFSKDLRIATNTLMLLGVSIGIGLLGLLADLLVQLNKRKHNVLPSTVQTDRSDSAF
jgi:glycosyltransferase involved in cell wall biosynthesis